MRRRTVLLAMTGGLGLAVWHVLTGRPPLSSSARLSVDDGNRYAHFVKRSGLALGTVVSISVVHERQVVAERAIAAAFEEIRLVERVMSLFRPDSQVSQLNRTGVLSEPHPYLCEVVGQAQVLAATTNGAFDITVQPLWRLHANAWRGSQPPQRADIEEVRSRAGWRRVTVSRERIELQPGSTAITLNGIAQGYAVDRVMTRLRDYGIRDALLDTGELGGMGSKGRNAPWSVGIQHPRDPEKILAVVQPGDRFLATSGDYVTSFSPDRRHHHILDPRTGVSPAELSSVTVAAQTGMLADGLSTALFVMGVDDGLQLLERFPNADALMVRKDGSTAASGGFKSLISSSDAS